MSPRTSISSKILATGAKNNDENTTMDEYDGRTRNARAQKRHREKQKARVKALEESVQLLTAQLEDARRQLGQLPFSGISHLPLSAHSSELSQLQAENRYLREENADQRRQLYALRLTYGGPPDASTTADLGASPPLRQGTSHSNRPRPLTNPTFSAINNDGASSASTPGEDSHRRAMSSSVRPFSAPSTLPYLSSSAAFGDLRSHSLSHSGNISAAQPAGSADHAPVSMAQIESRYPVRYESYPYPQNPSLHGLPRPQAVLRVEPPDYSRGSQRNEGIWGQESSPPFVGTALSYSSVNFQNSPGMQTADSWRQAQQ
ncbi:hypothetical protein I307_04450 [Cryptococcus deuterogattii 99/473]|uniref:Unplaced genomic scaffold supercont1.3, whole genome shotgun sequence n=1 Tax=Cryptococcus deuterogattii Ram5 TaxID=1296110 RepID=A0A0D0U2R9_9TREE|nr:hypothetical protein I313_01713 [Cryptococcus deuterogattii Ram5]KIR72687.1 hypothetical protein I310_03288 [Cryptococcus deuterogattii CA1014]KIY56058.1 hypothetical protein I307_04450 [Cryptococcus deuterogattii 99/473]